MRRIVMLLLALAAPVNAETTEDVPAGLPRHYLPPGETQAIEYLILTVPELRDAWQPLATMKTRLGMPAAIVTVAEITSNPAFAGCDTAESIRRFVDYMRREHGLRWLLLGGDVAQVPGRMLVHRGQNAEKPYVADGYYGCLGGDWNSDHDAEFGTEGRDAIDLEPYVFVGRVPAQTPREVQGWITKMQLYLQPKNKDYQKRALLIGANVFQDGDAETYYRELVRARLEPAGFEVKYLLPSEKNSDERNAFEEITRGYGIISHYQHSFMYNIGLQSGAITLTNLVEIKNAERPSVMWSNGCNVCQFDYQSIGEAILLSEAGGVVAIVGSSETNYSFSLEYERAAWELVFGRGERYGEALAHAKKRLEGNRFLSTSLSLLGDPHLPVWTDTPRELRAAVKDGLVRVTDAAGAALPGALVCLSGEGYYVRGTTGEDGTWAVPSPRKRLKATLGVSARNAVSLTTDVTLEGTPAPTLKALVVDGREIVPVKGVFELPAPGATARLDGAGKLSGRLVGAGDVPVVLEGDRSEIAFEPGDRHLFRLELSTGENYTIVLPMTGYRLVTAWAADRKEIDVRVLNLGTLAGNVRVSLDAAEAKPATHGDGHFRFSWTEGEPGAIKATVTGPGGTATGTFDFRGATPAPKEIRAAATPDSIRLTWEVPAPAAKGYSVYREDAGGSRVLLTPRPVAHATYLDTGLKGLTRYVYLIASVNGDGFEGPLSTPLKTSTALPRLADWPKKAGAQMSEVIMADLDGDGKAELLAGDEEKGLWVWRRDGTEWRHAGDNWTFGLFQAVAGGVFTPSVADIDGDGKTEIITCGKGKNPDVYVWDLNGRDKKGWPRKLSARPMTPPRVADLDGDGRLEIIAVDGFGIGVWIWKADGTPFGKTEKICDVGRYNYFLGPILDVDGDKKLEIVFLDGDARLRALRPDGTSLPGFPVELGSPGRSSVVAGDVNGDKKIDFVCLAKGCSELVAVGSDGKILKGFPAKLCDKNENFSYSLPALAELDGKKGLEIVAGEHQKKLWVFRGDGTTMPGWPKELEGVAASIAVADIDGDKQPDIIAASDHQVVHAFHVDGEPLPGFPLRTSGANVGVPLLGDFNGDRKLDLLLGSQDGHVHIWALDVPWRNESIQWNGPSNGLNFPAAWYERKPSDNPWTVPKSKKGR